jgi:hypothetical protein
LAPLISVGKPVLSQPFWAAWRLLSKSSVDGMADTFVEPNTALGTVGFGEALPTTATTVAAQQSE